MKKRLLLFLLPACFAMACNQPRAHKKAPVPKSPSDLVTGCYAISSEGGQVRKLSGTAEAYHLVPSPIVTVGNFQEIELTNDAFGPSLHVTLDEAGRLSFASATARMAGQKMAVVIDNDLIIAPVLQGEIPGGKFTISGGFTEEVLKNYYKRLENEMYEEH